MIAIPPGARVWLASGHTDMRRGFDGLALAVQRRSSAIRTVAIFSFSADAVVA